jgi:methylated-DNA-[protein]-cysteine S-methyltransferase
MMYETTMKSPVGTLRLVATTRGLREVRWSRERGTGPEPDTEPAECSKAHAVLERATKQLCEYFDGKRQTFDLPLDPLGTPFQIAAWQTLRTIPYGATRSYGEQAAAMGRPQAARAVGAANGRNPLSIVVPCHRVIGVDGSLVGFAAGLDKKRFLLAFEAKHV